MTNVERQQTADCHYILQAAIAAVNPEVAVRNALRMDTTTSTTTTTSRSSSTTNILRVTSPLSSGTTMEPQRSYDLSSYDAIVVVAFGKASAAMASAVVELLLVDNASSSVLPLEGVVICKDGHATPSQRLLNLVRRHGASSSGKKSLVVACLSGGGSALFCTPTPGVTLAELQATNTALLQRGGTFKLSIPFAKS
jgi:glycerate-2-kinase